jgi:hypothetical protein
MVVYCAGPLAQLLLAGVLWFVFGCAWQKRLEAWRDSLEMDPEEFGRGLSVFVSCWTILVWINVAWPLFNLLPIPPLDGGQIAQEVIDWLKCRHAPPGEEDSKGWKAGWSSRINSTIPKGVRQSGWGILLVAGLLGMLGVAWFSLDRSPGVVLVFGGLIRHFKNARGRMASEDVVNEAHQGAALWGKMGRPRIFEPMVSLQDGLHIILHVDVDDEPFAASLRIPFHHNPDFVRTKLLVGHCHGPMPCLQKAMPPTKGTHFLRPSAMPGYPIACSAVNRLLRFFACNSFCGGSFHDDS